MAIKLYFGLGNWYGLVCLGNVAQLLNLIQINISVLETKRIEMSLSDHPKCAASRGFKTGLRIIDVDKRHYTKSSSCLILDYYFVSR